MRQPLVLPIEGQVIAEFVQEQARQQADIRQTLLQHGRGRRRTGQDRGILPFEDLADILEDDIGAGLLG